KAEWALLLEEGAKEKEPDASFALAADRLGKNAMAMDLFERLRANPVESPGRATAQLGLAQMFAGKWDDGIALVRSALAEHRQAWRLDELLKFELPRFRTQQYALSPERVAQLADLEAKIGERSAELKVHPYDGGPELVR